MKIKYLTTMGILLALTVVVQMIGLPKILTGIAVNAILLIAYQVLGTAWGATIGLITPFTAFLFGIAGKPIFIPFIAAGNVVYVVLFSILNRYNQYVGIGLASLIKTLIIVSSMILITGNAFSVVFSGQSHQLPAAILGGLLASAISKVLKISLKQNNYI
ncbi:MAG TPA: ECF transporter S component [Clostridia bacterium]|nr:ECF transporter S component [Clostridia bacterium]